MAFYRELGDLFGVELRPHKRWAGFKALRQRWLAHLDASVLRPVLLIDEAQQISPKVLSLLLTGNRRLSELLPHEEPLPLGSRLRVRLTLDYASRDELIECLKHLTGSAAAPSLMTEELRRTLADHAMGNDPAPINMAP